MIETAGSGDAEQQSLRKMNDLKTFVYFDQSTSQIESIEDIREQRFAYEVLDNGKEDDADLKPKRLLPFGMQIRHAAQQKFLNENEDCAALRRYSVNHNSIKFSGQKKTEQEEFDELDDLLGSIGSDSISASSSDNDDM